jgi:hypothetical protein
MHKKSKDAGRCKDCRAEDIQITAGAPHYTQGELQVIDVIEKWNLGRNLANVVKYALRCEHKGNKGLDLEKLIDYAWRERYGTWATLPERTKK